MYGVPHYSLYSEKNFITICKCDTRGWVKSLNQVINLFFTPSLHDILWYNEITVIWSESPVKVLWRVYYSVVTWKESPVKKCYHGVDYFMLPLVSKSYPSQRYISTSHKLQPAAGIGAKLLSKLKALSQM